MITESYNEFSVFNYYISQMIMIIQGLRLLVNTVKRHEEVLVNKNINLREKLVLHLSY